MPQVPLPAHPQASDLVLPPERQATAPDPQLVANLLRRGTIWTDIMQARWACCGCSQGLRECRGRTPARAHGPPGPLPTSLLGVLHAQGETRESIERALREAGNNAPLATRIIRARKLETGQVYIPPAIYDLGEDE